MQCTWEHKARTKTNEKAFIRYICMCTMYNCTYSLWYSRIQRIIDSITYKQASHLWEFSVCASWLIPHFYLPTNTFQHIHLHTLIGQKLACNFPKGDLSTNHTNFLIILRHAQNCARKLCAQMDYFHKKLKSIILQILRA